jgi:hypothetical protein
MRSEPAVRKRRYEEPLDWIDQSVDSLNLIALIEVLPATPRFNSALATAALNDAPFIVPPEMLEVPELIVPLTSSLALGEVTPIPTFPALVMRRRSPTFPLPSRVENAKDAAAADPSGIAVISVVAALVPLLPRPIKVKAAIPEAFVALTSVLGFVPLISSN